ncbi:methyl-accepting chemotaxis protein [Anaerotignum sp. MB30-C6]|uniref:methyl-accepting chemotaxis protein n=1 Tax=Anaerotignum sp. MB30-C6 TaxID=3070814 RepID=UPI0027DD2212|nr:methyl-accepting chemotaxis protein [Anaerotignum sp. MB30-C6]WMI80957.1 methyl-accepting chemotaxis protein [Anaerotignum sp. MB30-C6]
MKSLKLKMTLIMAGILLIFSFVNTAAAIYLNYRSVNETVEADLKSIAQVTEVAISESLNNLQMTIEAVASQEFIGNKELSQQQVIEELKENAEAFGMESLSIVDSSGIIISTDSNKNGTQAASYDWYSGAASGETTLTSPLLDSDGVRKIFLSTKVNNKVFSGLLVATLDCQTYTNIITDITVNQSGNVFMLDSKGFSIADVDHQLVANATNIIEEAKTDKTLESAAAVFRKMVGGETDIDKYLINGNERICYYGPIKNTDGWSYGIVVPTAEMMSSIGITTTLLVITSVIFMLVGIVIAIFMSKSITNPIVSMSKRLRDLSDGDLTSAVPVVDSKDELGLLYRSLCATVETCRSFIDEISTVLGEISKGNLDCKSEKEYVGDFAPIKVSLETILESLNNTMTEIKNSAEQVAGCSNQVSAGAQALAQGATEQASSVEELSATITQISQHIKQNADNAQLANAEAQFSGEEVKNSNQQMQEMKVAINNINTKSGEISKIIKTIEDIAFQTNILALNAAVEAARAGSAGRGFAVVADEVRSLAQKSSEAAKDTTTLIEETVQAIEYGTKITDSTAQSMLNVVKSANKVGNLINEIFNASKEQASAISQITIGVEQISSVVQTNSATAEESAAASEEFSGQAQLLKEQIEQFKLKNSTNHLYDAINDQEDSPISAQYLFGEKHKY